MSKPQPKKKGKDVTASLSVDQDSILSFQKAKKWTARDIVKVEPMTANQKKMFESYESGKHVLALGSPGTGKSFLSIYLAFKDIMDKSKPVDHFKIVRSAVETRPLGFLKGSLEEKTEHYEAPYEDIVTSLTDNNRGAYDMMKKSGLISFTPTSFVRGVTWDNTVVLLDEVQNLTWHEIHSVVTRLGINSRLIVAGDFKQSDLNERKEKPGIGDMLRVIETMKEFEIINFTKDDCVRSGFVKSWLHRCEDLNLI